MPGGIGDKLTIEVRPTPADKNGKAIRFHATDITQEAFASLLERIKALPAMKGFTLIEEEEKITDAKLSTDGKSIILIKEKEGAFEFFCSTSGRGFYKNGRQPELIPLKFRNDVNADCKAVVSEDFWKRLENLQIGIARMPELKGLHIQLRESVHLKGYSLKDKKQPSRFSLMLEVHNADQDLAEAQDSKNDLYTIANLVADINRRQGGK